jgi:cobalamin biosynthesis protein CobD/CbiB
MTFISILFALLFEQLKPLRADNPIYAQIQALANKIEASFNAGKVAHGRLGWWIVVGSLTIPTALIYWLCLRLSPFAAFAWNVVIVYLTLGFRRYSHYFTSIQLPSARVTRMLPDVICQIGYTAIPVTLMYRRFPALLLSVHSSPRTVMYSGCFSGF